MQEKKNKNSNYLGIFQKLFNFFTDNLLARGVKRITLGQHDSLSPAKPNGVMMMVHFQDHENFKDDLGSEIQIQFKQFEGPVDKFGDQFQMHKAADRIPDQVRSSRDKAMEKGKKVSEQAPGRKDEVPLDQERIDQPQLQGKISSNLTAAARSRGPKKMFSNKDSEEEDRSKKKGKNIPTDLNLALAIQDEEVRRTPRRSSPLLGVGPNIDEKSDAFIKSRKEAMSRNLSMDTKPS